MAFLRKFCYRKILCPATIFTWYTKAKLHEHISDKPVFCSDCHKKDGYLDFKELGFPKQRIDHLNSTEIVGMIEKYKKFYLPSQIDFGIEKAVE
jgi:hypothetical protein